MYNLSVNPIVQEKLYDEIRLQEAAFFSTTTSSSSSIMNSLAKAKYLKQVVKESMRLYPVSVGTSRVLEDPCVIRGYKIPANVTVITMNQITCRLDEYVERANDFMPERFDPDSGFKKIRPFTLLPFGHGPRACIGRRVAEMSIYIFLYRLVRQYKIQWSGSKPLGFVAHSITEPDGPLHFQFSPRNENNKKSP